MMKLNIYLLFTLGLLVYCINAEKSPEAVKKKSWKDKDIRDMTEAELENILDQWEKDDDPLEPDELPEHLRPQPKIDLSQIDPSDPDKLLKLTKKGKGIMMFIDVNDDVDDDQADTIIRLWQSSLHNNHIIAERYPLEKRRSIFMFREGSQAIDAKNFLIEQPELSHVTLEGQVILGKHSKKADEMEAYQKPKKKTEL